MDSRSPGWSTQGHQVRLIVRLGLGATGEAVKVVQRQLNDKRRAGLTVDGTTLWCDRHGRPLLPATRRTADRRHGRGEHLAVPDRPPESPRFGRWMCGYEVGSGPAHWATGAAIAAVRTAAVTIGQAGGSPVAIGDASFEHGGDMPGHETHDRGLDVDIRSCGATTASASGAAATTGGALRPGRDPGLFDAIRAAAPGHIKVIYFNDPVLIREGLTRWNSGHDHLPRSLLRARLPAPLVRLLIAGRLADPQAIGWR